MNLKEIATEVLDEDSSPFKATENPDGTVTYSVIVEFDPEVQAEKAKAMPKGMKREDQPDDLTDTEDAAPPPRGIFAAALDEVVSALTSVEDASKHANTPLENCRAKDPMYCPYHGDKAIKKAIETHLKEAGGNLGDFSIEVQKAGKVWAVKVTMPQDTSYDMGIKPILSAFKSGDNFKPGINLSAPDDSETLFAYGDNVDNGVEQKFASTVVSIDPASDRETSMIDEWIDDIVQDISADKTLMQDLDPQDVRDLLGARQDIDNHEDDAAAKKSAITKVRRLYHGLRAQIDYRDIKTSDDADNKEGDIVEAMIKNGEEYHSVRAPVDAAKIAIFGKKNLPPKFAANHPWAEEYSKISQRVGHWDWNLYEDAKELANENAPIDLKSRRTSISEMDYARERYEEDLKKFKEAAPKFLSEFKKWAEGEVAAGNKTQEQFDAAFPKKAEKDANTPS